MATINISDELKAQAAARAAEEGYPSVDAYIAAIVEADAVVPIGEALEREILAGLATAGREMHKMDWDTLRQQYRDSRTANVK